MTRRTQKKFEFWTGAAAAIFGVKLADFFVPPHNPLGLAIFWGILAITFFILSIWPTHDARQEERG